MKKHTSSSLYLYVLMLLLGSLIISSCKKDKGDASPTAPTPDKPVQLSDDDSLTYLMYNIMQVNFGFVFGDRDTSVANYLPTYYWYKQVPKLNPLSSEYDSAEVLLNKIRTYPINPADGKLFDKYSFLDKEGEIDAEIQQGVAGDIGMQVAYAGDGTPQNTSLYVLFADKNSPAGKAGVTRGWEITGINGTNNVSYDRGGPNAKRVFNAVNNDPSSTFTFVKPDKSSQTSTLTKTVYDINPVLFDTVYSVSGKSVGYFVFNTFSNVFNSKGPTLTKQELDRVFNKFSAEGIISLIVDLRYNGGGSVETAKYLDSLIAPANVAGKVMFNYLYNDQLSAVASQLGLDKQVLFNGGGNLNLSNVFFIGSGHTASASELTLNNLKPYLEVKLVGDTTYGKPVGFFALPISDFPNGKEKHLADLYAINFETRNANNQGGYFNGIVPDKLASDFANVPWGNLGDDNLKEIFKYISTGSFGRLSMQARIAANKSLRPSIPSTIHPLRFNGMVDYKVSGKIKALIDKNLRRAQ